MTTVPFTDAGNIPVNEQTAAVSYSPITFEVPGRPVPLEVKVSMPATGTGLPVVVLSHGHGETNFLSSFRGYAPLVDFWAAHGFVVIQPTHLDYVGYGLRETGLPDAPLFWYDRAEDLRSVLDHLDDIERIVPGLAGRLDHARLAVVGHSLGGATASSLLGMRVLDPEDPREKDLSDARIKAGVIIAGPGVADDYLSSRAGEANPLLKYIDYSTMTGTALVINGDHDLNPNFSDRLSYRSDAYTRSPGGNKTLLTFSGAEHMYGGISGYDAVETTDENPNRVATLRALVWAYLRSQLDSSDTAWQDAVAALEASQDPIARVESK